MQQKKSTKNYVFEKINEIDKLFARQRKKREDSTKFEMKENITTDATGIKTIRDFY